MAATGWSIVFFNISVNRYFVYFNSIYKNCNVKAHFLRQQLPIGQTMMAQTIYRSIESSAYCVIYVRSKRTGKVKFSLFTYKLQQTCNSNNSNSKINNNNNMQLPQKQQQQQQHSSNTTKLKATTDLLSRRQRRCLPMLPLPTSSANQQWQQQHQQQQAAAAAQQQQQSRAFVSSRKSIFISSCLALCSLASRRVAVAVAVVVGVACGAFLLCLRFVVVAVVAFLRCCCCCCLRRRRCSACSFFNVCVFAAPARRRWRFE